MYRAGVAAADRARRRGHRAAAFRLTATTAAVALAACAVRSGGGRGGEEPATGSLAVRRGPVTETLLLTGELVAAEAVDIAVPATPTWQVQVRWLAEDGSAVRRGDRLLELDDGSVAAELEDKRLEAATAAGDLAKREAELAAEAAERRFTVEANRLELEKADIRAAVPAELLAAREHQERQVALGRAQAAARKAEAELAAQEREAEAELAILRLELGKKRAEITAAEQNLAALVVDAPVAGVVVIGEHPWEGRKIATGDTVFGGVIAVSLPDLDSLEVEAMLFDVDDRRLAPGMAGECAFDAFPDRAVPCRVDRISPIAQETGASTLRRAFGVVLALEPGGPAPSPSSPSAPLLPGMSVRAAIVTRSAEEALLAPRAALEVSGAEVRAVRASGERVPVELGACDAFACAVNGDLDVGDRLAPAAAPAGEVVG